MSALKRVAQDKSGVTALEYALIAFLIAIVSYSGISAYGSRLGIAWTNISTAFPK